MLSCCIPTKYYLGHVPQRQKKMKGKLFVFDKSIWVTWSRWHNRVKSLVYCCKRFCQLPRLLTLLNRLPVGAEVVLYISGSSNESTDRNCLCLCLNSTAEQVCMTAVWPPSCPCLNITTAFHKISLSLSLRVLNCCIHTQKPVILYFLPEFLWSHCIEGLVCGALLTSFHPSQLSLNTRKTQDVSPTPRPTASPQLCPPTTKPREAKRKRPSRWLPEESWYVSSWRGSTKQT